MNISASELANHDRIGINLLMLGFAGENRFIVEGANHVDDVLKILFELEERELREIEKNSWEKKPYDPRFD